VEESVVDFFPLLQALRKEYGLSPDAKLPRSDVGKHLKRAYPFGAKGYQDFREYSQAAAHLGYVTMGTSRTGATWITSTGKLETMCESEFDRLNP
jgi:hypothetical protein